MLSKLNVNTYRIQKFISILSYRSLSSFIGFFKTILITHLFGIGAISDAYFIFTTILTTVSGFIQQMSLNLVIPVYNEQYNRNQASPEDVQARQRTFISLCFNYFLTFSFGIALIIYVLHEQLIGPLHDKLSTTEYHIISILLHYTLPVTILFQASNFLSQLMLQRQEINKYFLLDIINGIIFITILTVLAYFMKAYALIWAFPFTSLILFISQLVTSSFRFQWFWKLRDFDIGIKKISTRLISWACFAALPYVDNYFLTLLPAGDLSVFRYSSTLITVLATLTVFNSQTTIIPEMALLGSTRKYNELTKKLNTSIFELFIISIIIISLGCVLAPIILPKLFSWYDKLSSEHMTKLTLCVQILLFRLPFVGFHQVASSCLNSIASNKQQLLFGVRSLIARIILAWIGLRYWGFFGIIVTHVIEYAIISAINYGTIHWIISKNKDQIPNPT